MRTGFYNAIGIVTGLMMLSACTKKNEQLAVRPAEEQSEKFELSVPLMDGRTSVTLKAAAAVSGTQSKANNFFQNNVVQMDIADAGYLESTTLMDLSKLQDFSLHDVISNKNLKITFVDSLIKMPGYPNGWTALWNEPPYVEQQSPTVLYTQQKNRLTITLSKYVEIFGFELAPNIYNSYEFVAGFYDSRYNAPVASVVQMAATPSGARLFAIKSEKPFNVIELSFTGDEEQGNQPYGFAIANIRYKLCKNAK